MLLKMTEWNLLARDAFAGRNRRAIAMMFVRMSVHLSVWDSCDHMVHFRARIVFMIGQFNVLGTLTPKHVHLLQPSFSSSTWKRGGV